MRPQTRRVTFIVNPVSAIIRVDGKALNPVSLFAAVGRAGVYRRCEGNWTHHTVSADAPKWHSIERTVNWTDPSPVGYSLGSGDAAQGSVDRHESRRGAGDVERAIGRASPVKLKDVPFLVDPVSGRFIAQRVADQQAGLRSV